MSKHIPQVPGQFTEGDDGLPEFWQKEFATSKEVAAAMKLLDITSIQTCPKCRQMWVNLNDEKCRKCGASMVHVVETKPAATVHGAGSGEPYRDFDNANEVAIVTVTAIERESGIDLSDVMLHDAAMVIEEYAEQRVKKAVQSLAKLPTPPASPTVTLDREQCDKIELWLNSIRNCEEACDGCRRMVDLALALLRAAERHQP